MSWEGSAKSICYTCLLQLLLGRLSLLVLPFLLGICLPSLWSLFFPLHAFVLILVSLAKVRLSPTLTLSSLMIWYSGLTALFLFLLARAALAYLPTVFFVALSPLFTFRQAQFVQVFPLKPVPFCTLFGGLGSTNKLATSLFFSSYQTLVLSSSPSFPLQSLVVSLLLPFVSTSLGLEAYCLIEVLRHTGFLDFHRKTCASSTCSLCSLSSTLQRTQPSVKFLSL